MALSSQSRRNVVGVRSGGGSRRWSRRRRRRRQTARRVVAVALLAGVAGGAWWLTRDGDATTAGSPAGSLAAEAVLPEVVPQEAPRVERAERAIAAAPERETAPVIRMGEPVAGAGVDAANASMDLGRQIREAARGPAPTETDAVLSDPPDESGAASGRPVFASPESVKERILWGLEAVEQNRLVDARRLLSEALLDPRCAASDKAALRGQLSSINDVLLFSPTIVTGDPLVDRYVIEPGDALSRIARKTGANVDWRFIQRVNQISDPRRIRVGQTLKIVKGPFHAVVDKSDYRMDVYAEVASSEGGGVVFVRSFPVGLGELDSTPTGEWVVRDGSKLVNPDWTNPRTGERFDKDDPKNPIGERWVGLRGTDATTEALAGYGIHGTIEPGSVGQQRSMGCVRLLDDDVELVYELMEEGVSRVSIVE